MAFSAKDLYLFSIKFRPLQIRGNNSSIRWAANKASFEAHFQTSGQLVAKMTAKGLGRFILLRILVADPQI